LIRVLLVAPSPALRAGLKALLAADDRIKIVNEAGEWSLTLQETTEADVMIVTSASAASFPNGSLALESQTAVLLLADRPPGVEEMARSAAIWGVLPLEASAEELSAAVVALSQGLIVGAPSLLFATEEETPVRGPLTDRETEVLGLLAQGLANKQIAATLGISEHTVKFHVSSIYAKLNVTNRTEAVRAGLRGGWIAL
jgi:DNA-binding NarL/FixJ family response regulator